MASDLNNHFGFELLNRIYDTQITKKEDVLILILHWYLVKNNFRCIGLGDSKIFNTTDPQSELLPEGWNQQPNYTLRYLKEGKLYILLGVNSDADLLLNLMRIEDNSVSNVQFPINATVNEIHGSLECLVPTHQAVLQKIRNDLVEPVYTGSSRHTSTQTTTTTEPSQNADEDPLRVRGSGQRNRPMDYNYHYDRRNRPAIGDPRRVGHGDLDPFDWRGGGMLLEPQLGPRPPGSGSYMGVPGRLPPGAVPPGARFDPFGPPQPDNPRLNRNPDDDHLPPPGYNDMFM